MSLDWEEIWEAIEARNDLLLNAQNEWGVVRVHFLDGHAEEGVPERSGDIFSFSVGKTYFCVWEPLNIEVIP